MKIFGFNITREEKALSHVTARGGWWPLVLESFSGAWQKNVEVKVEDALQYWAVFRCVSLISSDVAKLNLRLVEKDNDGIWNEIEVPAFSPVLRKPNRYQNRIQFFQNWLESKLTRGNTYVLKERDGRGVVVRMYVLDPHRVKPLVSDSGEVFYELAQDNLSGVEEDTITVPASEVIHDRWNTFYHPLCGLSPLYAAGINALAGLKITQNSARFFANGSNPGGILTAPGAISDETAQRIKDNWEQNFSGAKVGRVAVLGDGLKYERMTMSATDAQLIEQLKWTAETICGVFGVPAHMVLVGNAPTYNNVEALAQQYYAQCLQVLIEAIEIGLDEGLGLPAVEGKTYGTEFDLDDLMRMDSKTAAESEAVLVKAGIGAPNESRLRFNRKPVKGGDTPYLQQQNYSLAALDERDAQGPLLDAGPNPGGTVADPAADDEDPEAEARMYAAFLEKELADVRYS